MNNSWKLAIPAALALMVAGCATEAPLPPPAPVVSAPVVVPPSASVTVPETEATPVRPGSRRYRAARNRGSLSTGSTEQTTAGPSAVGRAPAAAQPVGTGGS